MYTQKRYMSALLALLLCLGLLSGCGKDPAASPTGSEEPSPSVEETPPADDGKCRDILADIPYYGDADKCEMTAEQALALAQLLADGIAGKAPEPVDYDRYGAVTSGMISWETPYTVMGYSGEYQTDRANAILGDFAGDGQPYLCVLSSEHPECCFDIYYSDGSAAKYVCGDETYGGRLYTFFCLDKNGRITISSSGATGAASHFSARYGVSEGNKVELHSWSESFNFDTQLMETWLDGEKYTYTKEEVESGVSMPDWEDLPDTPYAPIPLREMIAHLNDYAAAKGSDQTVTVEERSDRTMAAQAMLAVLEAETAIGENGGSGDACLVDLSGDGLDDLVTYNGSQARLHWWQDGQLQKKDVGWAGGGSVEWWLCRDTETGEQGIEWRVNGGGDFTGGTSRIYYLSREVNLGDYHSAGEDSRDSYTVDGWEATQEEYDTARAQNERVRELIAEEGSAERVAQTRAALEEMLAA